MGDIFINDDCLTPYRHIYMTYSGPDPWGVVKQITDSIRGFFHVSASGTSQYRLNWDLAGDPILFYSKWWVRKRLANNIDAIIYLWVQGTKSKVDNTGQFTLRINADVNAKYSGPTFLLQPLWVMYSYLYFNRVRRKFIESCRNYVLNFRNEIKEHYNLGITSVPSSGTVFGNW